MNTIIHLTGYGILIAISIFFFTYNLLYQHEVRQGENELGITIPKKAKLLLRVSFYLSVGALAVLSILIIWSIFILLL